MVSLVFVEDWRVWWYDSALAAMATSGRLEAREATSLDIATEVVDTSFVRCDAVQSGVVLVHLANAASLVADARRRDVALPYLLVIVSSILDCQNVCVIECCTELCRCSQMRTDYKYSPRLCAC